MDIRSPVSLKQSASHSLARGRDPQKVVTVYSAALLLISAVLTLADFWLNQQLADTGGLGNLGTNTILSTVQTVLPVIQSFVVLCLEFGYLHAMMRIARGQYADHTDLKVGFQHFGPIFRMSLLQGLLISAIGIILFYVATMLFLITPWGEPVVELLMPTVLSGSTVVDEATALQAGPMMVPLIILFIAMFLVIVIPILYRFRMANYALLDDPRAGAIAALRASRKMMRKKCLPLLKLDISFWWFYLLQALSIVLCYGDMVLSYLGIPLPIPATASFYLFYVLYLAAVFAINYFFRNHVEATYIMAYETLHEKPKDTGVVLGNIFDM